MERVQKIIAHAGICSRRKAEDLIMAGKVLVNGKPIKIGDQAEAGKDMITVDGKKLALERKRYFVLYKPKGCLCTVGEFYGKRTIFDFISVPERIYPVGRLDYDTEGLLLLTNDGDFANRIMHPRHEVRKVYAVHLDRPLFKEDFLTLRKGIMVDGRTSAPDSIRTKGTHVLLTLHEGRKHIVKKIFRELGYQVLGLKRESLGPFQLRGLAPGQYYEVRPEQLHRMGLLVHS